VPALLLTELWAFAVAKANRTVTQTVTAIILRKFFITASFEKPHPF